MQPSQWLTEAHNTQLRTTKCYSQELSSKLPEKKLKSKNITVAF